MAEKIYYCKNCDKTFSSKSMYDEVCPVCHFPIVLTGMNAKEWRTLTEFDKVEAKKTFSALYDMKCSTGEVAAEKKDKGQNDNMISQALMAIGLLLIIVGAIFLPLSFLLAQGDTGISIFNGFAVFAVCFVQGMLFYGFGEVIRLLQILVDRS